MGVGFDVIFQKACGYACKKWRQNKGRKATAGYYRRTKRDLWKGGRSLPVVSRTIRSKSNNASIRKSMRVKSHLTINGGNGNMPPSHLVAGGCFLNFSHLRQTLSNKLLGLLSAAKTHLTGGKKTTRCLRLRGSKIPNEVKAWSF